MQKWKENIRSIEPYIPGEQPQFSDMIKLNTNECPYPPSPMVEKVLKKCDYSNLRLYPSFTFKPLKEVLCKTYNIAENEIFFGNGSDEVLALAFMTFFNSKKPILFPDITYSFYDVWADVYKIPYKTMPLDDNFRINKTDYFQENGGIIFPNPNAPTGVYESNEMIEEIVKANKNSIVIIDEAYIDFGGESCIGLTEKYDNLLVVQTFSKSRSMAGMRIGYAIGNEKLIKYMNDVKFSINSYTMNHVTQVCGAAAVEDEEYFIETIKKITDVRENTKKELKKLGFTFTDSKSNFLFAAHDKVKAETIFNELKSRKIYVRYWNKPRINNYLRISIGTAEEMEKLISALKEIVS